MATGHGSLPQESASKISAAVLSHVTGEINIHGGHFLSVHGTYNKHPTPLKCHEAGLDELRSAITLGAMHDSSERYPPARCHPGTREHISKSIMNWILEDSCSSSNILWLNGAAGVGKSAIMQNIADWLATIHRRHLFAGSFFFARGMPGRDNIQHFLPTIAYQIAHNIPGMRSLIDRALVRNPVLLSKCIDTQLLELIVNPFRERGAASHTHVVLIDGLDEVANFDEQRAVLRLIADSLALHRVPLRFLVASRHEREIQGEFDAQPLSTLTKSVCVDKDDYVSQEIAKYLKDGFSAIYARQLRVMRGVRPPWPAESEIQWLVKQASGQFLYASVVLGFVGADRARPVEQLKLVLSQDYHPRRATLFSNMDRLYTQILESCSPVSNHLLDVLGLLAVYRSPPLTFNIISTVLGLEEDEVAFIVDVLSSVVTLGPNGYQPLYIFPDIRPGPAPYRQVISIRHISFSDFLLDASRSRTFHVDKTLLRSRLEQRMEKWLAEALFGRSTYSISEEVWWFMFSKRSLISLEQEFKLLCQMLDRLVVMTSSEDWIALIKPSVPTTTLDHYTTISKIIDVICKRLKNLRSMPTGADFPSIDGVMNRIAKVLSFFQSLNNVILDYVLSSDSMTRAIACAVASFPYRPSIEAIRKETGLISCVIDAFLPPGPGSIILRVEPNGSLALKPALYEWCRERACPHLGKAQQLAFRRFVQGFVSHDWRSPWMLGGRWASNEIVNLFWDSMFTQDYLTENSPDGQSELQITIRILLESPFPLVTSNSSSDIHLEIQYHFQTTTILDWLFRAQQLLLRSKSCTTRVSIDLDRISQVWSKVLEKTFFYFFPPLRFCEKAEFDEPKDSRCHHRGYNFPPFGILHARGVDWAGVFMALEFYPGPISQFLDQKGRQAASSSKYQARFVQWAILNYIVSSLESRVFSEERGPSRSRGAWNKYEQIIDWKRHFAAASDAKDLLHVVITLHCIFTTPDKEIDPPLPLAQGILEWLKKYEKAEGAQLKKWCEDVIERSVSGKRLIPTDNLPSASRPYPAVTPTKPFTRVLVYPGWVDTIRISPKKSLRVALPRLCCHRIICKPISNSPTSFYAVAVATEYVSPVVVARTQRRSFTLVTVAGVHGCHPQTHKKTQVVGTQEYTNPIPFS